MKIDCVTGVQIGYARVSTNDQNLDLQLQALKQAGCELIYSDKASGALAERKGLNRAIRRCRNGDILVIWKLDRLGRSLIHLVGLVEKLRSRGVGLRVLTGQGTMIDTTRPEGRMIFGIFAALAEFERELIRERTRAGIAVARQRGVHCGRPAKLSPAMIESAQSAITHGEALLDVATRLGVHQTTLRRSLKRAARTERKSGLSASTPTG